MLYDQIAFIAVILAGFLATYTDIKTGYIYDWITYPLLGLGIVLGILQGQFWGIVFGIVIYVIGYFAYSTGKLGGGDVKLLAGIATVQPFYKGMIFVLPMLLIGSLAASVGLGIYYTGKYLLSKPKINWNEKRKKYALLFFLAFAAYVFFIMNKNWLPIELGIGFLFALFAGMLFYAFEEEIKENSFLVRIPIEKLEDDELLAWKHLSKEEKEKLGNKEISLIDKNDILRFKQLNIHTIPVYRNLPQFAPFLLFGILVTYLFPQLLLPFIPVFT